MTAQQQRSRTVRLPAGTDSTRIASLENALRSIDAVTGVSIANNTLKIEYLFPDVCFALIWQLTKTHIDTAQLSSTSRMVHTLIACTEANERDHLLAQVGWDIYIRDIFVASHQRQAARRASQKRKPWQQVKRPENSQ